MLVGDLEAGMADGQVTPQAGQDLSSHLQQLLFGPPGQDAQYIRQQYTQLVQAYDQRRAEGQITGRRRCAVARARRPPHRHQRRVDKSRAAPLARWALAQALTYPGPFWQPVPGPRTALCSAPLAVRARPCGALPVRSSDPKT